MSPKVGSVAGAGLLTLDDQGRLQDRVRASLKGAIADGSLEAGSLYSVQQLAAELGVSRSPVREALIKLAEQGLVRFERNRGVRIQEATERDIQEVFQLRLLMEVPAVARAVATIDDAQLQELREAASQMEANAAAGDEQTFMAHDLRFHDILLTEAGNVRLAEYVRGLRELVLNKGISTTKSGRELSDILAEHEDILAHVEAKRPEEAALAMQAHLLNTAALLLEREGGSVEPVQAWIGEVAVAVELS